ncbi:MAG: hypothetical protein M1838_003578 [Thelocarpon superellum]|nr:MAG: hypothetical protein M1838_003578 [Thelocarpon superellum]
MSSSAPRADNAGSSRRRSISQFIEKAKNVSKSVLRRDKSKRQSIIGPSAGTLAKPDEGASAGVASAAVVPVPVPARDGTKGTEPKAQGTPASPPSNYQQRARAMFEKYGFTLEDHEWFETPERTERVQKPIRMRIHRSCHRCQTTFGADKICAQCDHRRCKKCPRYPLKKAKLSERADNVASVKSAAKGEEGTKQGSHERVRREAKQAIRRVCHQCETHFARGEKTCSKCGHVRCVDCPRFPAKSAKRPEGTGGDPGATSPETSPQPKRYVCHSCGTEFENESKPCPKCKHERCDDCGTEPPDASPPTAKDDGTEQLEEKLGQVKLEDDAAGTPAATASGG